MVAQDGTALRIKPEGMTLGLQDDRKFGATSFALHGLVGRRRTLKAGEPVHFAVELTADTAAAVDAEAQRVSPGLCTAEISPLSYTRRASVVRPIFTIR